MKMKRVLPVVLALVILLSLAACGRNGGSPLVGAWVLVTMDGVVQADGETIVFHADGYGERQGPHGDEPFQWQTRGSTLFIRRGVLWQTLSGEDAAAFVEWDETEEEATFRIRGNQLILTHENDGQLVLVRRD